VIGYSATDTPVNKWQLVIIYKDNSDCGGIAKLCLAAILEILPPAEVHVVGDILNPDP
jgi:hypothetical protein